MEIYEYLTISKEIKYGFIIYTDDTKQYLSYESAGFETEMDAKKDMEKTLKDFGWD